MKHIKLSKRIMNKSLSILGALSLLFLIFLYTNPEQVPLALLLVPFLVIGFVAYQLMEVSLSRSRSDGKRAIKKLIALAVAFAIMALLLLASLGQLTFRDGLLVIGFVILFLFYIVRADFLENKQRS
jgi:hypothetical protein